MGLYGPKPGNLRDGEKRAGKISLLICQFFDYLSFRTPDAKRNQCVNFTIGESRKDSEGLVVFAVFLFQ